MHGGVLHSWLGDRLLDKSLWKPTRESVARAWLVGFPITMIPFLPGQTVVACIAALLLRGNLLLCIALQFLSNFFTAPAQLSASYLVGEVVRGENPAQVWRHVRSQPRDLWSKHAAGSLYLGAIIIGVVVGGIGYGVIHHQWRDHRHGRRPPSPHRHTGGHGRGPGAPPVHATAEAPRHSPSNGPPPPPRHDDRHGA